MELITTKIFNQVFKDILKTKETDFLKSFSFSKLFIYLLINQLQYNYNLYYIYIRAE